MSSNNNALPCSLLELFPWAIYSLSRFAPCFPILPSASYPICRRGPSPPRLLLRSVCGAGPNENEGVVASINCPFP